MNNIPTILGVAEATHYLVGSTDTDGDFVALSGFNDIAVCSSLSSAKNLLKGNNVKKAQLVLETAYDEMCGLAASEPMIETFHL